MTTYREECGTPVGLRLHQAAEEEPCADCREAELLRRLDVEAAPVKVAHPLLAPVTPGQAAAHRRAAVEAANPRRRSSSPRMEG